jgi:F-type H+-transporting ATPase subunit a
VILGIEFPSVSHVTEWPDILLEGTPFAVNKVVLLIWLSALITFLFIWMAGRDFKLVPSGVQNVGESLVDFIEDGIVLQTIGPDGMRYVPLLGTIFTFIFVCNIWEIVPGIQMPVNARMAIPLFLTLVVYVIYMFLGIKNQGPWGYFKNTMFIPGVPKALYILVAPIELLQILIVRPLSLSVRLFANMLAGHLLLVSFAVICAALWSLTLLLGILPFAFGLLVGLTGFEILVAFLQAFIFTILTAVYIGSSLHPEH